MAERNAFGKRRAGGRVFLEKMRLNQFDTLNQRIEHRKNIARPWRA
jgi:hypothetical protein